MVGRDDPRANLMGFWGPPVLAKGSVPEGANVHCLSHRRWRVWTFERTEPRTGQKLSAESERIISSHTCLTEELLVFGIIRHHHERWDGNGYPDGLKGEEIPVGARIIAIADIYDALTFQRPYSEATSPEQAITQLRKEKGKSLNPNLVEVFVDLIQGGIEPALASR